MVVNCLFGCLLSYRRYGRGVGRGDGGLHSTREQSCVLWLLGVGQLQCLAHTAHGRVHQLPLFIHRRFQILHVCRFDFDAILLAVEKFLLVDWKLHLVQILVLLSLRFSLVVA